jgi:phosphatidylinositol 4-kinase type 2
MPRHRPPTSGYARIAQADEEDGADFYDDDIQDPHQAPKTIAYSAPTYEPIQGRKHGHMHMPSASSGTSTPRGGRRRRMRRSSSGVDIKAINARLERWADEIAAKFKITGFKGKSREEEQLEIHHSVFQAPEGVRPVTAESFLADYHSQSDKTMTKLEFDDIVESVRTAIELGTHPKMISQGSSGSYFARNTDGKVVGVFKPKDEEPYASRNPKWTKWLHRNLFPCFFGRACLIPNLSYVSEAAAYVLDARLQTHLVPYTDVVHLSSKAFYYDYWQRSAFYRKRKPLPEKPGSFQVFLKGYKDANIFLRENPWPDVTNTGFNTRAAPNRKPRPWNENCRPTGATSDDEDEAAPESRPLHSIAEDQSGAFRWTDNLQQSFREELEKLVILDYLMRNTDRGLDNWMVKIDRQTEQVTIHSEPVRLNTTVEEDAIRPIPIHKSSNPLLDPYRRQETMMPNSRSASPAVGPKASVPTQISLGAIDNSLSWPWKHPDAVSTLRCTIRATLLTFYSGAAFHSVGYFCQCRSSDSPSPRRHETTFSLYSPLKNGGVKHRWLYGGFSNKTQTSKSACSRGKLR